MAAKPEPPADPQSAPAGAPAAHGGAAPGSERRRGRRTHVAGLWCDRGQVIDLSPRGMRLLSYRRWSEGQQRKITITDGMRTVTVGASCVWCRQEGLFSHTVGLAFEAATREQAQALEQIADRHAAALSPISRPAIG